MLIVVMLVMMMRMHSNNDDNDDSDNAADALCEPSDDRLLIRCLSLATIICNNSNGTVRMAMHGASPNGQTAKACQEIKAPDARVQVCSEHGLPSFYSSHGSSMRGVPIIIIIIITIRSESMQVKSSCFVKVFKYSAHGHLTKSSQKKYVIFFLSIFYA